MNLILHDMRWIERRLLTKTTCLFVMSSFKSNEILGDPLETVPEPYESALMKSMEIGRSIRLTRSAKKRQAPVATPTKTGGSESPENSEVISDPSWATRSAITSALRSTFSMCLSSDMVFTLPPTLYRIWVFRVECWLRIASVRKRGRLTKINPSFLIFH